MRRAFAALASVALMVTLVAYVAPPRAAAADDPRILVYPDYDSVGGWNFTAGASVTMTMDENPIDVGSQEVGGDGSFWLESPDPIDAGATIVVTAGGVERTHVVTQLTVEGVIGDVVTGKASGPTVHFWVNETAPGSGDGVDLIVDVVNGDWSVDVGAMTTLVGGMGGSVEEGDAQGNATAVDWNVPDPRIMAEISRDQIWGQDLGWPVTVTIEDNSTTPAVIDTWTAAEIEHEDGSSTFQLTISPRGTDHPWDLKPGQTVTVKGTSDRTLVIAGLAITGYDLAANTVSGTADPAFPIYIDITREGVGEEGPETSMQLDGAASWTAAIPDFDIALLDEATAKQPDGDGDETWFYRRLAPPRFAFAAELQEVSGFDWPTGATVTLTVDDPATESVPDFSATTTAGLPELPETFVPSAGGEPNVWFDIATGAFRAGAGDTITMTDGSTTKTQLIPDLTVNLPVDPNKVTGTTELPMPAGSFLWGMPGTTPDADGTWAFQSSEELARPGVWAIQIESDGDQTAVSEPYPRIWLDPQADRVWAIDFAGQKVTLTVTHSGAADQVREAQVQNVFYGGWEPVDMWTKPTGSQARPLVALFDLKGDIDLQAGDVVTVTDGLSSATRNVGLCSVDTIDPTTDTMTGQATTGSEVGLHIGADRGGYWGYSVTPVDDHWSYWFNPDEFPNQGLDPGMKGQAFCDDFGSVVLWSIPSGSPTATTIKADSPDPTVVGQVYAVSVTVRPMGDGTGRPLGTMTIADGSGATCTDTTSAKVDARTSAFRCSLRSTTAGTRTLTATFNPAAGWAASSGTASHLVKRAATSTQITNAASLAVNPTKVGTAYTVAVKVVVVKPGSGIPAGSVTVSDGSATCTVPSLSATGTGSCSLTSTSAGWKTITARYAGTPDFLPSKVTVLHRVSPS